MKKSRIVIIVVVLILLSGLYLMRAQIKSLLGMKPASSISTTPTSAGSNPENIIKTATSSTLGTYLTDFQGKTLYTFDKDTPGVSNCTGPCVVVWPVYTSAATTAGKFPANISVIKNANGYMQFTWKQMPLYYYGGDSKPGDTLGNGIGGVWHMVKP